MSRTRHAQASRWPRIVPGRALSRRPHPMLIEAAGACIPPKPHRKMADRNPAAAEDGGAQPRFAPWPDLVGGVKMASEAKGFPLPSSVKVAPGTEAAQAAYPY